MINAKNITKTYKDGNLEFTALKNVSLKIIDGDFVIIKGRSGSGKSTFMYQLSLLDNPTSGKILFNEIDITSLKNSEKTKFRLENLGYIFQDYALLPELTAAENVLLPMLMLGKDKKSSYLRSREVLSELQLGEKFNNLPSQLSGGEQQRVSIARALINNPKVIFADEPTANLDSENSEIVMNIFQELNKKGQTIVLVTHEEEYFKYATKLVTMLDGELSACDKNGKPCEV